MRPARSIIALVAAYAIALQALLAGWVVVSHAAAAASLGVICTHDGSTDGGVPAPAHGSDCLCGPACTMAGHGATVALLDTPSTAIPSTAGKGEVITAAYRGDEPIASPKTGPQLPRAPPMA